MKSHIGSLKRKVMIYKSNGLLLLPICFRMELHLFLLPWTLVEVDFLLVSSQQVVSEPIVRLARRQRCGMVGPMDEFGKVTHNCWSSGNTCAATWLDGIDKLLMVAWHLSKGFRSRGSMCVDVVWKRLMCEGEIVGNVKHE